MWPPARGRGGRRSDIDALGVRPIASNSFGAVERHTRATEAVPGRRWHRRWQENCVRTKSARCERPTGGRDVLSVRFPVRAMEGHAYEVEYTKVPAETGVMTTT